MAHRGRLRSTPVSSFRRQWLSPLTYKVPPLETQNSNSEPALQRDSLTGAAQWPGVLVRSGMAMLGKGRALAVGGTLVNPTRKAPCHSGTCCSTLRQSFSWTFSGRLLNTRPFLNVCPILLASCPPRLSWTMSPTAWTWKDRGPRQDGPHLCDLANTGKHKHGYSQGPSICFGNICKTAVGYLIHNYVRWYLLKAALPILNENPKCEWVIIFTCSVNHLFCYWILLLL